MDPKSLSQLPPWEWPQDAGKHLLFSLLNDDAAESERVLAANLAGNLVVLDDEIAGALLALAGNPDASEKLREAAAIALGPALENADMLLAPEEFEDEPISEEVFVAIKERFHELFFDESVPEGVRRRVMEASVRAPEEWHEAVIRDATARDDPAWRLTAVFCMGYVQGFDAQILEALESEDPKIHYHAVVAAGTWSLDEAWPHVARLIQADDVDKELLVAAVEAVASIRPDEAPELLVPLLDSSDEDVVSLCEEALAMCDALLEDEDGFDDESEED